jgi:phosphomannomutase
MYGFHNPVRDGSMTMALILWIMANEKRSLSQLVSELPQYAQLKDRVIEIHIKAVVKETSLWF